MNASSTHTTDFGTLQGEGGPAGINQQPFNDWPKPVAACSLSQSRRQWHHCAWDGVASFHNHFDVSGPQLEEPRVCHNEEDGDMDQQE